MYKLDRNQGSVSSIIYHLIICIKYRQQVFKNDNIVFDIKQLIENIAKQNNVVILEQNCGIDHIHILFRAKPSLHIPKFINLLKGYTSRYIRKKYKDYLSDKLWGDHFWSPSYFLATTGNVTIDILKKYIEEQRSEIE